MLATTWRALPRLQADQLSLLARDLLPLMLEAAPQSEAGAAAQARACGLGPRDAPGRRASR